MFLAAHKTHSTMPHQPMPAATDIPATLTPILAIRFALEFQFVIAASPCHQHPKTDRRAVWRGSGLLTIMSFGSGLERVMRRALKSTDG
jgi:hypothetical protein